LKILFLSITSEIGGADLAMLRTVRELDRAEFQAVVAFPEDGPLVEAFRQAGAETVFFPMKRLRKTFNPFWHLKYLTSFSKTCRSLCEYIAAHGVDLVHTNSLPNLYGSGAARRAGVPHIWEIREIDLRPRIVRRWLVRQAHRGADRIVAMSQTIKKALALRPEKLAVIYGSVDLGSYVPDTSASSSLHDRLELPANCRLAGIWCRFDEWKGLPVAIRAAGLLAKDRPDFRLLIAGGPTAGHEQYADYLKALAGKEAPGAIVFTGWLAPDDIPGFVAGLDVAVHASTSPEPFGLVIAEAMAAGTPLVAPRIGSPLELVAHKQDGLLYEAGNPTALAVAVKRFLDDPELAAACAKAGRVKAEELFDVKENVRKLESIYRELAKGGNE
jgi:glycosyltransferase involved in cell wall biosynthesis